MNDILIPGWVVWIMVIGILPWLLMLTRGYFSNNKDIAVNTANDLKTAEVIKQIYFQIKQSEGRIQASFEQSEIRIQSGFNRLEGRVDSFVEAEIKLLKELAAAKK